MTQPQHLVALAKANQMRLEKARLRKMIHNAGLLAECSLVAADVLEQRPACLANTAIGEVLTWRCRAYRRDTQRRLDEVRASWSRPVGELTDRQVAVLAAGLRCRDVREAA